MMDLALIFTGGNGPGVQRIKPLLALNPFLVAADSGLDLMASMGLVPDLAVGDFDSVNPVLLQDLDPHAVLRHPSDKDLTDTELALELLSARGFRRIILVGGGGGRLDHLLAIFQIFSRPLRPERWYTEHDELILIEKSITYHLDPGSTVSFFPADLPCRAKTSGLQWPLDKLRWGRGDCGVSNRVLGGELSITMIEGALLMVRSLPNIETPGLGIPTGNAE